MAYSSITKPEDHFNTKLYTGNGGTQSITGVGFQPDWLFIKSRGSTGNGRVHDSVRGVDKQLYTSLSNAEYTYSPNTGVTSFDSDGFSLGSDIGQNTNTETYVAWNWLAGGTAPAITYTVKVVSDSGNKYRFDDFGTSAVTLDLQEGGTYTFDQSDSSNSGHPLRFSTTSDGTHGGGSEYTTNVTTTGTPGSSGAQTVITVAASAPTLYYYCSSHSGMGGQANTNSTFGSSNFSGSIQANVSASTTAGFSIVTYTGTGSAATVGHGLGAVPQWLIVKNKGASANWRVYHVSQGNTKAAALNSTSEQAVTDSGFWNNTTPTSSVFSIGSGYADSTNASSNTYVAYCFAEKKGYSKFGSYVGNGVASGGGPFIYLGFKPAFFMLKETSNADNWIILDNRRLGYNKLIYHLFPNLNNAEYASDRVELRSNGVKVIDNDGSVNTSGATYIYMAFAENPFVANDSGTSIPTTGF